MQCKCGFEIHIPKYCSGCGASLGSHTSDPAPNKDALYDVLTVKDVAKILKISLPLAYALFKRKDFPVLPIAECKQKRVSRAAFERWLMRQQG